MKIAVSSFILDIGGYGEMSRRFLRALRAAGAEVAPGATLTDGGRQMPPPAWLEDFLRAPAIDLPDVHLVVAAATDFPMLTLSAKRRVGVTCWETSVAHPAFVAGCAGMDLIVVPSSHSRDALRAGGLEVPIRVVPVPALEPPPEVRAEDFGVPVSAFFFYSILSWQERKNHDGLLVAYFTAFIGYDDVVLVLAVPPAAVRVARQRVHDLREAVNLPNPPEVHIITAGVDEEALWPLHQRGDCYVTLTRGEACGIPIMDARAVGNPVIVPDWGGHLDYLPAQDPMQVRVPSHLVPVVQRYHYFDGSQCWADPDLRAAREAMQTVFVAGRRRQPASGQNNPQEVGAALLEILGGD